MTAPGATCSILPPTPAMRRSVAAYRQYGSFAEAARQLGVTDRAVHKSVRQYEARTGERVAPHRGEQRVRAGKQLTARRIEHIIRELEWRESLPQGSPILAEHEDLLGRVGEPLTVGRTRRDFGTSPWRRKRRPS